MEPTTGIEPVNLFLTKEALYRLSYVGSIPVIVQLYVHSERLLIFSLERETRFELATSSLEG
jgi:hypothetical protein